MTRRPPSSRCPVSPFPPTCKAEASYPSSNNEPPNDWRDAVYYHYHQVDPHPHPPAHVARHYGIRTSHYKLIYIYDHNFFEFYDLKTDPEEMNNLAGQADHAGVVASLKKKLKELRVGYGYTLGNAM